VTGDFLLGLLHHGPRIDSLLINSVLGPVLPLLKTHGGAHYRLLPGLLSYASACRTDRPSELKKNVIPRHSLLVTRY